MSVETRLGASFRDPSGFVYKSEGTLLRQVNASYRDELKLLGTSGLYEDLVNNRLLIPHTEVGIEYARTESAIAVLRPEVVRTISYPYEWCFGQLKDAALATLKIQARAVEKGMSLKDASAYNIQFHGGKPLLIDSLSFESFEDGKPWTAYRQFCQHFIAPLVLMSSVDVRLGRMSALYIDGIPLDLASSISKPVTRFSPRIGMHLHLHAKMQSTHGNSKPQAQAKGAFGKNALLGLIDSLKSLVDGLNWDPKGTEWADYYSDTNYSKSAMDEKHRVVGEFLSAVSPLPSMVWDLGANNGEFSALSTSLGFQTVAWDIDPAAVEKNYRLRRDDTLMLPLVQDLTNPSPSLGWSLRERESLLERGPVDAVMALALIHHLAIGNNVPLPDVAAFFAQLANWLVIEFVPKEDSQVQRLLSTREDVFPGYHQAGFESAFEGEFVIDRKHAIAGTSRTLYLMRRRTNLC